MPLNEVAVESLRNTMLVIGTQVLELRRKGGDLGTRVKEDGHWDIVTEADEKISEPMLTRWVRENFPDHGVVGEEGTNIESKSGYVWYFDPIDGTINYRRNADKWGISAGLAKNGIPVFGAIYYPALETFLWTTPGRTSASCETDSPGHRQEMEYSSRDSGRMSLPAPTLKESLVVANYLKGHEYLFGPIRSACMNTVMFGSMVYDVLMLVEGKVDAMFHTGATPFDIGAGVAIARAAGCTVSGIMDDGLDLSQKKIPVIFARSESLRDQLRVALKEAVLDAPVK